MITPEYARRIRLVHTPAWIPSRLVEYAFYFAVFYSLMSEFLGIEIPLVASAVMGLTASFCILKGRSHTKDILAPIALLFACAVSFIVIQVAVHGGSILDDSPRAFINWILGMIVVQSLCLRDGFPRRCTIVLFVLGFVLAVPHLQYTEGVERARLERSVAANLANPNALAGWFGFCGVYSAIFGFETKHVAFRLSAWVMTVASLFIVGLTVSRGVLIGFALAITFAARRFLGRSFVPIFMFLIVGGVVYETGLFTHIVNLYTERGMEETGRELIWPVAIDRVLNAPYGTLIGLGASSTGNYIGGSYVDGVFKPMILQPHNSFLYFLLSSGIVPLGFYVLFLIYTAGKAIAPEHRADAAYRMPLLLYLLVNAMLADLPFMAPWGILSLCIAAGFGISYQVQNLVLVRRREGIRLGRPRTTPKRSAAHT